MDPSPSAPLPPGILFGAAYYAEYHQSDRLELDLDLMQAGGFTVIRVGESVWSTWEPRDGEFDLEWLAPVLDGAHQRGIGVILGTPTYAVPPWLQTAHPEIAGERRTGERIPWGARQEVDYTHPAFRFHAERVIRAILGRYADHPAIIGYQVDNEPGLELFHNHGVFARFVRGLKARYGDVATLNREWGLTYWSHRIDDWSELWRPDGNTFPQYDLAWRRFQAEQTTEFIAWQAGYLVTEASAQAIGTADSNCPLYRAGLSRQRTLSSPASRQRSSSAGRLFLMDQRPTGTGICSTAWGLAASATSLPPSVPYCSNWVRVLTGASLTRTSPSSGRTRAGSPCSTCRP